MADFVLVHGSSGGGVVLATGGAPPVSGRPSRLPPDAHRNRRALHLLSPQIDLSTHITDVSNVLFYEDIAEAVLVGHSYGGMVITGVAQAVPERVSRLIYFDAYLPEPGESRWDLLPDEMVAADRAHADAEGYRPEATNTPFRSR